MFFYCKNVDFITYIFANYDSKILLKAIYILSNLNKFVDQLAKQKSHIFKVNSGQVKT